MNARAALIAAAYVLAREGQDGAEALRTIETIIGTAGVSERFEDGEEGPATEQGVTGLPEMIDIILEANQLNMQELNWLHQEYMELTGKPLLIMTYNPGDGRGKRYSFDRETKLGIRAAIRYAEQRLQEVRT